MYRMLISIIALLVASTMSIAQLTIVSTSPSNGAVNVSSQTSLEITFSAPLDTSIRYSSGCPIAILLSGPTLTNPNLTYSMSTDLRTIRFPLTIPVNTDCGFIIFNAQSTTRQGMSHLYASNFTSMSSFGIYNISGSISYPEGNPVNSFVALFQSGSDNPILFGVCSPGQATYTINGLRGGGQHYALVAGLDLNGDGELNNDPGGWYDTNNDGEPDEIIVDNVNVSNINITLHLELPITALERIAAVRAYIASIDPNATIKGHWGDDDANLPTGRSYTWQFRVLSPLLDSMLELRVNSYQIRRSTSNPTEPGIGYGLDFPLSGIDSDSAFRVAERNGGAQLRNAYPTTHVVMTSKTDYDDPENPILTWHVCYNTESSQFNYVLRIDIDVISGAVRQILWNPDRGVDDQKIFSTPDFCSLNGCYPNPFNATTEIKYTIAKTSNVDLRLFDVTGREVAKLINFDQHPGSYTYRLNGSVLASGTYFVRLQTGSTNQTQKIILLR